MDGWMDDKFYFNYCLHCSSGHVLKVVLTDYSFWGPYIFFFLGTGIGGTYIGNVVSISIQLLVCTYRYSNIAKGMIVTAMEGSQTDVESQIIIFSVAQTVSRVIYLACISHPKIGLMKQIHLG